MRAKGLKIEKVELKKEPDDIVFKIFVWFIKICIAIPFIAPLVQCVSGK